MTEDANADCIPKVGTDASNEELLKKTSEYDKIKIKIKNLTSRKKRLPSEFCELKRNDSATGILQAQLESA